VAGTLASCSPVPAPEDRTGWESQRAHARNAASCAAAKLGLGLAAGTLTLSVHTLDTFIRIFLPSSSNERFNMCPFTDPFLRVGDGETTRLSWTENSDLFQIPFDYSSFTERKSSSSRLMLWDIGES